MFSFILELVRKQGLAFRNSDNPNLSRLTNHISQGVLTAAPRYIEYKIRFVKNYEQNYDHNINGKKGIYATTSDPESS